MRSHADAGISVASARADVTAERSERAALLATIARLERELVRAGRCLAAERAGRESLRQRLIAQESSYQFAVGILCRRAFPTES